MILPVDSRVWAYSSNYRFPVSEVSVESELFIVNPENPNQLISFDGTRVESGTRHIRITKSTIAPDGSGFGLFSSGGVDSPTIAHTKFYYTMSAKIVSGINIDLWGLRNYLTVRKSIWIKDGNNYPFIVWGPEDIQAARIFQTKVPMLYFPERGMDISGDFINQDWQFSKTSSQKAITWLLQQVEDSHALALPASVLPKDWIQFENTKIQIPTAKYPALHFYDPASDSLIVFYVIKMQVPLP